MTKLKPIFRQVGAQNYSKLGLRRKRKLKYRRPSGGDNKIRLNRAGRIRKVKIGFKNEKSLRGLINGKKTVMIYNLKDLEKIGKNMIGVIGKIGNKNKKFLAEKIIEDKIEIYKFDPNKFLKNLENKIKEKRDKKEKRNQKRKEREKKSEKKSEDREKLEDKIEEKKEKDFTEDENKVKEAKIKEN
jgi:ribosomal protein L32E